MRIWPECACVTVVHKWCKFCQKPLCYHGNFMDCQSCLSFSLKLKAENSPWLIIFFKDLRSGYAWQDCGESQGELVCYGEKKRDFGCRSCRFLGFYTFVNKIYSNIEPAYYITNLIDCVSRASLFSLKLKAENSSWLLIFFKDLRSGYAWQGCGESQGELVCYGDK